MSPEEVQRNQTLSYYAIGILGLAGRRDEFATGATKGLLSKAFQAADPTLSYALEFVREYTFSRTEIETANWDKDMQAQNTLVHAFGEEALAHTANEIATKPLDNQVDGKLVENTISIGHLHEDVNNPHYAKVLFEGMNRGIWGSLGSEVGMVREMFKLHSRENEKVTPILLAHRGYLPKH